jgi:methyl-accepting chemotaxis protein
MQRLRNLSIMTKLMVACGLSGLIMAGIGYVGLANMAEINSMLHTLYGRDLIGLSAIKQANVDLVLEFRAVREAIIYSDAAELERVRQNLEKLDQQVRANLERSRASLDSAEGLAKLADVEKAYAEYLAVARRIVAMAVEGKKGEATEALVQARATAGKVLESFAALAAFKEQVGKRRYDDSDAIYFSSRRLLLGAIAVGIGLGLGLGFLIARMISRAVVKVHRATEQAAAGDLAARVEVDSQDELGAIGTALNGMLESFHGSMREVRQAAEHTASASQQLASGSEQLSSGAQEQASSLEETAASLEEITGTVKQNADNARQASQLAAGSRDTAEKGGQVVTAAVAAMGEINQASKRIADIITTIDEIAFQTNLLALNAAVEAARAGEQGRGFAVVAAEVRNLAQRSATAAKEIKGLIEDSVQKVEVGSELVNRSGETLGEIVASVKRVTDIIAEIAAASQEQTTGMDQVNRAVTQMDQVVQSNASQTEELSATAESLAQQAAQLQSLVGRFKLGAGQQVEASGLRAAAPVSDVGHGPAVPARRRAAEDGRPGRQTRKADVPVPAPALAGSGSRHGRTGDDGFEEF